jgi:hypothetical protein
LKTNEYSSGLRKLSEDRLREYITSPGNFHDEAVLAAIWELSNRRPLLEDEKKLENDLSEKLIVPVMSELIDTIPAKPGSDTIPFLYSRGAIQLFSVLFSVLAGGILMAINFHRTRQKNELFRVLGFSLSYTVLVYIAASSFKTPSSLVTVVLNLLGAFLIGEFFWNRVLGRNFQYVKQSIWTALLVALILISPLIWYLLKYGPEFPE